MSAVAAVSSAAELPGVLPPCADGVAELPPDAGAAVPPPGSVGCGWVSTSGTGSGRTTAVVVPAPLLPLADLLWLWPLEFPLLPVLEPFAPVIGPWALDALVGEAALAAGADVAAAPADVEFWLFCTRLKKCVPPASSVLSVAWEGGGVGLTGRAMAGNAVMMVLSSEAGSASRVPADNSP